MLMETTLETPIALSPRVAEVAGMFAFDVPRRARQHVAVEVPSLGHEWQLGLITGPSASGKTTMAELLFPGQMLQPQLWPSDRAVIDCLPARPTAELIGLLTAVGFSSPPAWLKPFHALSTGEQFRCGLARALAERPPSEPEGQAPLVVVDEFTSVVDRRVARTVSAAVAKAIRGGRIASRLVAVSCHDDIARWLQPDWIIDMGRREFQRRRLRRPPISLQIYRCGRRVWEAFAGHHYLSGSLPRAARCYVANWEGEAVYFAALVNLIGRRGRWRFSRIVTLPDCQGLGIGTAATEALADSYRRAGQRVSLTTSHPAMIAHCRASPRWRLARVAPRGGNSAAHCWHNYRASQGRPVSSFEYEG